MWRRNNIQIASVILTLLLGVFMGCYQETAIPVKADFKIAFVNEDPSVPVQIAITNQSTGGDTFEWTFEGAAPSSSSNENPGTIMYKKAGTYTIKLTVSNVDGSRDHIEKNVKILDGILVDFSTEILESNFVPAEVVFTNHTEGVNLLYHWSFEGGSPSISTLKMPPTVTFNTPGDHLIKLDVSNGFESFSKDTIITIAPEIKADFDWEVDFFDDDYQAPVTLTMFNKSISATSYRWSFEGANILTSSEEAPKVTFNKPGSFNLALEVSNGKQQNTIRKEITIRPNTNLRSFQDIELAINGAHNGNIKEAFFSTILRKGFMANEVTDENGGAIDIVFLGLNATFSFNKFVSPDEVAANGFSSIPNATHTKFINSQEVCGCSASMSVTEFDSMTDDRLLKNLTVTETNNGLLAFDDSIVPRIVLFETHDQRKGAIKIKEFVANGAASYVVCDIKVQKE